MLLAFDDDGPGPVVVLLHGFPLNRSMWSAQRANIGSTYRVITPDLRGHGETAAPDGIYTMDAMADDVIDLLNAMQLTEPIVLGGMSMGGYIALSLIARHPERVRALILMDTRAGADSPEAAHGREELARKVETSRSVVPLIDAMLPKLFSPLTGSLHPQRIGTIRLMMEKVRPRAAAGALRGMAARPDRTSDLARIRVPTLVLVGADDKITPPEEARSMAEAIPDAHFHIIPEAGHLAPLENPAATNEAILRFLSRLH